MGSNFVSEWKAYHNHQAVTKLKLILSPIHKDIDALSRFDAEIHNNTGQDIPGMSLYALIVCTQMQLESKGIYHRFLDANALIQLHDPLDIIMKEDLLVV